MNFSSIVFVLVTSVAIGQCSQLPTDPKVIARTINRGLEEYRATGVQPDYLRELVDGYDFPKTLLSMKEPIRPKDDFMCIACKAIIEAALTQIADGATSEELVDYLTNVCTAFTTEKEDVCRGLMNVNVDVALYIINAKPGITTDDVCGVVYQSGNCGLVQEVPWEVNIAPPQEQPPRVPYERNLKAIQITDTHYDPYYFAGGSKNCGRPTCCTFPEEGEEVPVEDQAGVWGEWSCDTPMNAVVDLFQASLNQHPDVDMVYFTGDVISHRVWNTSIEENDRDLRDFFRAMADAYGNVRVYPVIGNHEPHPVNVFSPDIVDAPLKTSWLFDLVAEEWMVWLPAETKETLLRGGYYTVKDPSGLRIVGLNSNVASTYNWWMIYDTVDPYGQLQWLADTLHEAESNGELVHILSHVPPGNGDLWVTWSREYKRIVERYSHIIAAEFNGDTHNDELKLFYNKNQPDQVINVAWNGGSATTFTDKNPNYIVYHIDAIDSMKVNDFESWYYDVQVANAAGSPQWSQLYSSFKEAFGLNSLNFTDLGNLPRILLDDQERYVEYIRFMKRDAQPAMDTACFEYDCRLGEVCYIVTTEYGDRTVCDSLSQNITNI